MTNDAKLIVLYNRPADAAAFDAHYSRVHIPLVNSLPGLLRYEISTGPVNTPEGPSPYHLVAVLSFDSLGSVQAAMSSEQGAATVGDLQNFAHAGLTALICATEEV